VPEFWYHEPQPLGHLLSKGAKATTAISNRAQKVFIRAHTLFVTVLANFRMFDVFPFSQRSAVNISRTFVPSCLLVRVVDVTSFLSNSTVTAGLLGPLEIGPDRVGIVPLCVLGVREVELVG
jgi:hypothetical protein